MATRPGQQTSERFTVKDTPKIQVIEAQKNIRETRSSVVLAIVKCSSVLLLSLLLIVTTSISKLAFISIGLNFNATSTYKDCSGSKLHKCQGPASFVVFTLLLMVPQLVCFLRALWKSAFRNSQPWPSKAAIFWGVVSSLFEVAGLCTFVFGVATSEVNPSRTAVFMTGIFIAPILWQLAKYLRNFCKRDSLTAQLNGGYVSYHTFSDMQMLDEEGSFGKPKWYHVLVSVLAAICAFAGIVLFLALEKTTSHEKLALPISLILLSIAWCPKIRKLQIRTSKNSDQLSVDQRDLYQSDDQERFDWEKIRVITARERSVVITSALKLLITPFVSLLCVNLFTDIDVKTLGHGFAALKFNQTLLMAFAANIVCGVVAPIIGWLSCTIGVQRFSFALPLTLTTPLCVLLLQLIKNGSICEFLTFYPCNGYGLGTGVTLAIGVMLWLSQILSSTIYLWRSQEFLMAREDILFWVPSYDGIFVEQGLVLNRKNNFTDEYFVDYHELVKKSHIYICTTMYHEADFEMEQLLQSLARIDKARQEAQRQFEAHIFLDDGAVGDTVKKYALQLLSLLEGTLGVPVDNAMKLETPYGLQLKWRLPGGMPFILHLKDNLKVKNKKRWSQVMYMSYILDFKQEKAMDDLTYILTTDADVKFTPEDVISLMDMMSRNPTVGAVCGRTHPIGTGPLVWYQTFDYAVGHWLLKVAEDVFGTVLCSPGCFSVYRATALRDILPLYASGVDCAMDFLTKDMGEDRWLCTLMIESGWRLEYCATAENYTYCPDNFDEFFKQRRRWTPSTLANQILVITESRKIRENNDLISLPFIIYQVVTMLSTIIGPSTVILIIAGGLQYAYPDSVNLYAVLISLLVIVLLFTWICLKAPGDMQLTAAKVLTFVFSVIMAVTIVGILLQTVGDVGRLIDRIEYENNLAGGGHSNSSSSSLLRSFFSVGNSSIPTVAPPRTTIKPPVKEKLFLLPTTWYLFAMIGLFVLTALLHGFEFVSLVHGLWYLLCLPSGSLLLTIYSVANLTDRSWGTREDKSAGHSQDMGVWPSLTAYFKYICWCCVPPGMRPGDQDEQKSGKGKRETHIEEHQVEEDYSKQTVIHYEPEVKQEPQPEPESSDAPDGISDKTQETENDYATTGSLLATALPDPPLKSVLKKPGTKKQRSVEEQSSGKKFRFPGQTRVQFSANLPKLHSATSVEDWLQGPYRQFIPNFKEHGYDNVSFITGMKEKDLTDIGVDNRGVRKKLAFQIQCLPPDEIAEEVPENVEEWLTNLGLEEYWPRFERNSYTEPKDLADLKFMDKEVLGVTFDIEKEGHLRKLLRALKKLQYPTEAQIRIRQAKKDIERVSTKSLERDNGDDGDEYRFWVTLRDYCLLPEQAAFGQSEALKDKLGEMRDGALLVLAVSNILWLTFMVTVMSQGAKLAVFGTSFASVAFLFVYTLVLGCQFIAMLTHRLETWIHALARAPFLPGKFHRNWSFNDDELPPEPSLEKLEEIRRRRRLRSGSNTPSSQGSRPPSPTSLSSLPPVV